MDITSIVPISLEKWTHVVVVYEPANLVDASLTMDIDGVEANTIVWSGAEDCRVTSPKPAMTHGTQQRNLRSAITITPQATSLNLIFGGVENGFIK